MNLSALLRQPIRSGILAFLDAVEFVALAHSAKATVAFLCDETLLAVMERTHEAYLQKHEWPRPKPTRLQLPISARLQQLARAALVWRLTEALALASKSMHRRFLWEDRYTTVRAHAYCVSNSGRPGLTA